MGFAYIEAIGRQQPANCGKFRKIIVGDDREPVLACIVCRLDVECAGIFRGQGVGQRHVFCNGPWRKLGEIIRIHAIQKIFDNRRVDLVG